MVKKIVYIFTRKQKIKVILLFLVTVLSAVLETLGVSIILPLASVLLNPSIINTNKYLILFKNILNVNSLTECIVAMTITIIVVYIIKNLFLMWQYVVQNRFILEANLDISSRLMRCYINQDYSYHTVHNVADLNRNITSDVNNYFTLINSILNFCAELITCVLIIIYLVVVDVLTTLILSVFLGVVMLIVYNIYKRLQVKAGQMVRSNYSKKSKWILQTFGGIKEIKALNREDFFYKKYVDSCRETNKIELFIGMLSKFPKYVLETIMVSTLLMVVCIRVAMGTEFKQFAVSLSALAVAAMRLMPSFNRMTEYISSMMKSLPSLDAIYIDLIEQKQLDNGIIHSGVDAKTISFTNEIVLDRLNFSYPESTTRIIKDISINIRKYDSVAFIGPSGGGKTTLADIILGLLIPNSGGVYVDGININCNLNDWHRKIGYIPQDIYLIDDTIRNNILFGLPSNGDDSIWKALDTAQIYDFVKKLPDGLDTQIGNRGVRLSGGQRQRIGIARAIYNNPQILIFDEATSALDNDTEAAVMDSVEKLHGKITLIIIAHRLSTIKSCDKVYEINSGIIKEKILK